MKFIDLETGNLFDGNQPYVFWFPGQQSTDLIYNHKILFVSSEEKVSIKLLKNEVFSLIDPTKLDKKLSSLKHIDINTIKMNQEEYISTGYSYHNYYIHVIYLLASSNIRGEYVQEIYINNVPYLIGADFYVGEESLHINLLNNGIDIPNQIQKAIYDSNIYEDKFDNILLNRKWKELLSNYWDILANKGSYKSLINSLNWFEYGDVLRLKELRKYNDHDKTTYLFKDINEVMTNMYTDYIDNYSKTTYLSISLALKQILEDKLDDEMNPVLKKYVYKWTSEDMSLKLSLLGSFYKTYFTPIHLDLIQSTIEDIVFSNNIKEIVGSIINRQDYIFSVRDFDCSVKEDSIYRIGNVETFVYPNTLFGTDEKNRLEEGVWNIVGVQTHHSSLDKNQLNPYISQMYTGVGVVIPFDIDIPLKSGDFIKRSVLVFNTYDDKGESITVTREDHSILYNRFSFNLLCKHNKKYSVSLEFDTASGEVFVKNISFSVLNQENCHINVYKVMSKRPVEENLFDNINNYIMGRQISQNNTVSTFTQYLHSNKKDFKNSSYKGVKLNRLIIVENGSQEIDQYFESYRSKLDLSKYDEKDREQILLQLDEIKRGCIEAANEYIIQYDSEIAQVMDKLNNNCFKITKTINEQKYYDIYISKDFGWDEKISNIKVNLYRPSISMLYVDFTFPEINCPVNILNIYRDDYIFVPGFHYLIELGWESKSSVESLDYYTVTDNDTLCVIPDIGFGRYINEFEWVFKNESTKEEIVLPHSVKEPFILNTDPSSLKPGYYSIHFNYKLVDGGINSVVLNSAFRKI